jgi:hypothetical protein
MAVRKLDDESSLLGLAKDGSKTGLGILDMLVDSIIDVRTGDSKTLSAVRVPETSSGDGDGRLVANCSTDMLLCRGELAICCVLNCAGRMSSSYSKENLRVCSKRSDSGRFLGARGVRCSVLPASNDGVRKPW